MRTKGLLGFTVLVVFISLSVVSCSTTQSTPNIDAIVNATLAAKEVEIRLTDEAQQAEEPTAEEPAPTEAPAPTEEPAAEEPPKPGQERIVIYGGYSSIHGAYSFTELGALAFTHDIDLVWYEENMKEEFFDNLNQFGAKAVIIEAGRIDESILLNLSNYLRGGGRVLFVYGFLYADYNETLKELFNVSIVVEMLRSEGGTLFYPEKMLPSFMKGYRVVASGDKRIEILAYVATTNEVAEAGYLGSASSNRDRMVYFTTPDKSVTFYPEIHTSNPPSAVFFDDGAMHYEDNEQAALALLRYLIED